MRSKFIFIIGALGVVCSQSLAVSVIVGGSNTIDSAGANQLASWLGEGDIVLTRIFQHANLLLAGGDTLTTNGVGGFHDSVDG